jgi:hypothetical protein
MLTVDKLRGLANAHARVVGKINAGALKTIPRFGDAYGFLWLNVSVSVEMQGRIFRG